MTHADCQIVFHLPAPRSRPRRREPSQEISVPRRYGIFRVVVRSLTCGCSLTSVKPALSWPTGSYDRLPRIAQTMAKRRPDVRGRRGGGGHHRANRCDAAASAAGPDYRAPPRVLDKLGRVRGGCHRSLSEAGSLMCDSSPQSRRETQPRAPFSMGGGGASTCVHARRHGGPIT